jgi:hypothetical protein
MDLGDLIKVIWRQFDIMYQVGIVQALRRAVVSFNSGHLVSTADEFMADPDVALESTLTPKSE